MSSKNQGQDALTGGAVPQAAMSRPDEQHGARPVSEQPRPKPDRPPQGGSGISPKPRSEERSG